MYVPSLLVFPRRNMKAELLDSPPSGSIAAGWIQRERERELYAKVQIFCLFCEAI